MRCNVSKCRQKIKLIKLINFELRCTSSFSLRRSEGEMPTSGTQGRADPSKQSDTRYKLEQSSCICYLLSNLICTVYARNSEPTQNSDPNGIPTSVLRISERNSEPHGIPTGKLRRGGLRDHMTKAIYN